MAEIKTHFLIVDDSSESEQLLTPEVRKKFLELGCQLTLEKTDKGARAIVADTSKALTLAIFCPPHEGMEASSLLSLCISKRGAYFPVYALEEAHNSGNLSEIFQKQIPLKHYLGKKLEVASLLRLLARFTPSLSTAIINELESTLVQSVSSQEEQDPARFIGLEARTMLTGSKSLFNVFIRLGDKKFVRLIKQGDAPDAEQISKYMGRGVQLFYVRKEIQELYVRYCDQVSKVLLKSDKVDMKSKMGQTLHQGHQTFEMLRQDGIDVDNIQYAAEYVSNLGSVVKQMNLVNSDHLAAFLGLASRYEHNTAVAAMAGLLAKTLNLGTEKSAAVIGMAGLFHDVGLMELGMYDKAHHIAVDGIPPEQRTTYESHPAIGAQILADMKRFDSTVVQAVSQHHLRKDNSGFPNNGSFTHIHLCAEIIGICDEFDYALRKKQKNPGLNVVEEMEKIFPSFSRQVVKAFRTTFLNGFTGKKATPSKREAPSA